MVEEGSPSSSVPARGFFALFLTTFSSSKLEPLIWPVAFFEVALVLWVELRAVSRRYFVNDDYQMLYTAWLRSVGKLPHADFGVQSYHLLPDLLAPFYGLCGERLETAFAIRLVFLVVLAALAILTARLTLVLIPGRSAPFAFVLSLCSWPMLERGLDIRPDTLSAALWLATLLIAVRPLRGAVWSLVLGGTFTFAVALRPKSLLLAPALLLFSLHAQRRRYGALRRAELLREALWLATGAGVAAGLFAAYLHVTHQWSYFVVGQQTLATIARTSGSDAHLRERSLSMLFGTDPVFLALALLGLLSTLHRVCTAGWSASRAVLHLAVVGLLIAMVAANPAFYTYNFLVLLPLLTPYAGTGCATIIELIPSRARAATSLALLVGLLALQAPLLFSLAAANTNEHQIALARAIAATPADTTVFALEGIGLFRPSTHDFRLAAVSTPLYRTGRIDLLAQLKVTLPEIVILSYRVPGWLSSTDQSWLAEHYAIVAPNIATLTARARRTSAPAVFTLSRRALYRVQTGACEIDGVAHAERATLSLAPGRHVLRANGAGDCALGFAWPEGAALESPALPYLIFPDIAIYPVRP